MVWWVFYKRGRTRAPTPFRPALQKQADASEGSLLSAASFGASPAAAGARSPTAIDAYAPLGESDPSAPLLAGNLGRYGL